MKEIESNLQTPEQLLRHLDTQRAAKRALGGKTESRRIVFLVSSLLIIVAAATVALMVLEQMLVNSSREGNHSQPGMVSDRKF